MNRFVIFIFLVSFLVSGCAMTEGEKKGAIAGGVIGATAGAIIGHQSGDTAEGAAIGGVIGALGGTVIGRKMEEQRRENPSHIRMTEIVEMSQKGIPDDVIIDDIKRTRSVYYLNSELIDYLRENGVSNKVIDYMISTGLKS